MLTWKLVRTAVGLSLLFYVLRVAFDLVLDDTSFVEILSDPGLIVASAVWGPLFVLLSRWRLRRAQRSTQARTA